MSKLTSQQEQVLNEIVSKKDAEVFSPTFWQAIIKSHAIFSECKVKNLMNQGVQAMIQTKSIQVPKREETFAQLDLSGINSYRKCPLSIMENEMCVLKSHVSYVVQISGNDRLITKKVDNPLFIHLDEAIRDACIKYKATKEEVIERLSSLNGDMKQVAFSFENPKVFKRAWKKKDDDMLSKLLKKRNAPDLIQRAEFLELIK